MEARKRKYEFKNHPSRDLKRFKRNKDEKIIDHKSYLSSYQSKTASDKKRIYGNANSMSKIDKSFLNKAENENKLLPLAAKFVPKYSSENTNYYRIENIESLLSNCIECIKNKFKIYQVKADGNCFYRALSYFLYNIEDNHNKISMESFNKYLKTKILQMFVGSKDEFDLKKTIKHFLEEYNTKRAHSSTQVIPKELLIQILKN